MLIFLRFRIILQKETLFPKNPHFPQTKDINGLNKTLLCSFFDKDFRFLMQISYIGYRRDLFGLN